VSPPTTLAGKVVAIHEAMGPIGHAFGGALALAYYAEPRATIDIDLNVFVAPTRFAEVVPALERAEVVVDASKVAPLIERDGQVRLDWDGTPLDLFFSYDPFHDAAARARREVPFADTTIPILSAEHLTVCKVVFDRPKDWVDIDAMVSLGASIDIAEVLRWVARIVGDEDPRYSRVAAVLSR
jgi:hypothetical protein